MQAQGGGAGAGAGGDQNYTSFPAVKTEELLSVLHEMNLNVTAEDIARPQSAMVQMVFMAFLDTLAGVLPEMLERRKEDTCGGMEHREIFEDGVGWLVFYREVRAMMEAATVHDFHLQDLMRPNAKRFKRHMSALVNFFRFRSDRLAEFDELVAETEDLEGRRLELEEGIDEARRRIEEHTYQRQVDEPEVQRLRDENLRHSDWLLDLKREQGRLLSEVDALKAEKADLVQQQTDVQYQLQIVGTDLSKLQARIVSRPEDIRNSLAEMNAQVRSERSSLAESERKGRALAAKMDVLVQLERDVSAATAAAEQVAAEMERVAHERRAVEEAKAAIAAHEYERSELEHRAEQLDRHVRLASERLERARRGLEERRAASRAKMDAIHARLEAIAGVRRERHALVEVRNGECAELERQLESVLQEHDAHVAKMQLEKDSLSRTATAYMDAVSRVLQHTETPV